jgi:hypothetical protein
MKYRVIVNKKIMTETNNATIAKKAFKYYCDKGWLWVLVNEKIADDFWISRDATAAVMKGEDIWD